VSSSSSGSSDVTLSASNSSAETLVAPHGSRWTKKEAAAK
jgi:hypothetical protein